jgi:flagellar biosynthesis GTPase FlhF
MPSPVPRPAIPEWLSSRTPAPVRQAAPETAPRHEDASVDLVDESIRARELVTMVRDELASMRREMNLSRQLVLQSSGRRLAPDVQAIADGLEQSGAPVALRSLLLDQIAECADAAQATETIRKALVGSIKIASSRGRFEGVHVIAGPSGSGKTQMAFRLASRHAAVRGASSVALISFADQRIGAWTQLQMLAARPGIDCYRVADSALLGALLGELSSRELILIDTAADSCKNDLPAIADCAPSARFHLVLPADASISAIQRFNSSRVCRWDSLMISKLDESAQPWPVIQSLCNQEFSLSLGSYDAGPDSPPREIDPVELVDGALTSCLQVGARPVPEPTRVRRSAARKTSKELKNAA